MIWSRAYLKSINNTQAKTIKSLWAKVARLETRVEVQQKIIDAQNEEIRELTDPVARAERVFRDD
jgi:uncharacterized coiled-coil protein SlyX